MKKFNKPMYVHGRFQSYVSETFVGFFLRSIAMYFKNWWVRRKLKKEDISLWQGSSEIVPISSRPKITWIGHSSFLIQIAGVNIITDPILIERSALFPRYLPVGIPLNLLPSIDVVLISHNHPDHMDLGSLSILKEHANVHFLTPFGDKEYLDRRGFDRVSEYTWWQRLVLPLGGNGKISFTFLPANHWSKRSLFSKKNASLWGSWMIECGSYKIYFAGDTAYESHFCEIGRAYKEIDIALMPIGPCEPRRWLEVSHIDSIEAGKAFLDLGARHFIPMHWGTFPIGTEMFNIPVVRLIDWWDNNKLVLKNKTLHTMKIGQSIEFCDAIEKSVFSENATPTNIKSNLSR
jgi:L-ascorbate metabolism protein UlaG (beta-lactamase superfamily)